MEDRQKDILKRLYEKGRVSVADLSREHAVRIASTMLDEVSKRAQALGVTLEFDAGVATWITEIGYAPEKGARELRHTITEQVEDAFANALLEEKIKPGERVTASVDDGRVVFTAL